MAPPNPNTQAPRQNPPMSGVQGPWGVPGPGAAAGPQGGGAAMPNFQAPAGPQGGGQMPHPAQMWGVGNWNYMPQTDPYSQGMGAQANAGQNVAEMGLYGQLASLPYGLANTVAEAIPSAQASMYGADRIGQAQEYSSYYPAAAQVQTAHMDPWAQMQTGRMQSLAGQNIAQINAERSLYGMLAMLQGVMPMFQNQSQISMPNIGTNYGAGLSSQAA